MSRYSDNLASRGNTDPAYAEKHIDVSAITVLTSTAMTAGVAETGPFTDSVAAIPATATMRPGATRYDYWAQRVILIQMADGGAETEFSVVGLDGANERTKPVTADILVPINAQDETSYDGSPATEGSFTGGTGHAAADVITLNDGTLVTVDVEAAGVVTEFTVTSLTAQSTNVASGTVLTQTSTTGSGTGFTMTLGDDNLTYRGEIRGLDSVTSVTPATDPGANVTLTSGNAETFNARAIRLPTGGDITFRSSRGRFLKTETSHPSWTIRAGNIAEISAAPSDATVEF